MTKQSVVLCVLAIIALMFTGCATISHKNIETKWNGLGVDVEYRSQVAINPADIPAFIRAVDKLERLLK
jgi:hypothetical protein